MIRIYHNNRCSKSRSALQILNERKLDIEIVNYLDNPPTIDELSQLLNKLGLKPEQITRTKEALFKEVFTNELIDKETWIKLLTENPKLIERPIVEFENTAIVARPPELLLELLSQHGK